MAHGAKVDSTKSLNIRMRSPTEIVDTLVQKIASAGIDTVAGWNALLDDAAKFDPAEKQIIKLLFEADET